MLLAGFWLSDLFINPIFYLTFSLCFDHFVYFFAIISLNIQYFSCYTIIYKNVWSDLISPTPINWRSPWTSAIPGLGWGNDTPSPCPCNCTSYCYYDTRQKY